MSDSPDDPEPESQPSSGFLPSWMMSGWFRAVLFVLLLAPVVALVAFGHANAWGAILFAVLGLAMLLFNNLVYKSNAWERAMQYRNSDDIEQSDFGKAYSMGCGGLLWLAALGFALVFFTHK